MEAFQKHLPINMQSGLRKAATCSNLRRLIRAQRIELGLRPAKITLYGKRWATIQQKAAYRAERDRRKAERERSMRGDMQPFELD